MVLICDCGKQATIKTSWTNRNPGRRFYCCPSCGFIGWTDPPMCCRAVVVIPGLLRARNELEEELEEQLRNPGRRFYCCPSCGFIGWTDPPMCCRAVVVIPGLLRARNELEEELEEQLRLMMEKDQQLKKLNKLYHHRV
ncbi:zinc finger, GRF-type [Artemisia annua]|uniref:Zinc finger, GRF-type n=1 Tax=Artemisia annua TaxID=35608 RepID=A0A2U1MIU1_ARTAN|nr:zinc finger, GRF-type [Artemisia annua]